MILAILGSALTYRKSFAHSGKVNPDTKKTLAAAENADKFSEYTDGFFAAFCGFVKGCELLC